MLYPINVLIWLYATTAYHVYWNVSDNRVICHICIPYYILKKFWLSCFSTIGIYPFIYSNLSDNHVICIAVFCSKCLPLWLESQTDQAHVPQIFFPFNLNIIILCVHHATWRHLASINWPQKGGGREIKPESTLLIEQTDRLRFIYCV